MKTRKSRALIWGKLHHCQKALLERDQLRASPQSSPKIEPHVHPSSETQGQSGRYNVRGENLLSRSYNKLSPRTLYRPD